MRVVSDSLAEARLRAAVMAVSGALIVGCEVALLVAGGLYAAGALYFGIDGAGAAYGELAAGIALGAYTAVRFGLSGYREELVVVLGELTPAVRARPLDGPAAGPAGVETAVPGPGVPAGM